MTTASKGQLTSEKGALMGYVKTLKVKVARLQGALVLTLADMAACDRRAAVALSQRFAPLFQKAPEMQAQLERIPTIKPKQREVLRLGRWSLVRREQ